MREKTFADIQLGQKATFTKTITEADIILYAGLTGDFNPIHVDAEYARTTRFGQRIAHGLLVAGLVQPALSEITTPGGVSLHYEFNLKAPVRIGDTITAEAEVIHIRQDKPIVTLATRCTNQRGEVVIEGKALIYMVSEIDRQA
jgi:3-hydroxybutyryl-CoA dehydratase